jgi:hypothetical protein
MGNGLAAIGKAVVVFSSHALGNGLAAIGKAVVVFSSYDFHKNTTFPMD